MPRFFAHAPRILTEEVAQCREVAFFGRQVDVAVASGSVPRVACPIADPKTISPWREFHLKTLST